MTKIKIIDSLLLSLKLSLRFAHIFHDIYTILAYIFYSPKVKKSINHLNYHKENILVVNSLIDKKTIKEIVSSMDNQIKKKNIFNAKDLLINSNINLTTKEKISKFTVFKDNILRNMQLFYHYPKNYLTEVSMVRDPLRKINLINKTIQNLIFPIIKDLTHSNLEMIKCWAYRTENKGRLTRNYNGKFHNDGDYKNSLKCIVYLSDVNINNGPFCYKNKKGEESYILVKKGTVIFFNSTKLLHKGSDTINSNRYCFSFLVHPAPRDLIMVEETIVQFQRKTCPFLPLPKKSLYY